MITGPCRLCRYSRPLYWPTTKKLVELRDGQTVLACVRELDDALPMVLSSCDVAEKYGWACFERFPEFEKAGSVNARLGIITA